MIILLLLSATGHAWPHQPVDNAKLAGLAKLAGALAGGGGENEVVKAHQSEGGWRLVSKAQKGKAGRGWGLKDGLLAGNPRSPQAFGRPQQDQGPSHGGQVAKFQQAAIGGGGTFGSASEQVRDFNLLSAFEQFVEGSQGVGKYEGKTRASKTGREEENWKERNVNVPEIENKRKEREEGRRRVEDSLSKLLSTSRTETNARKDEERKETSVEGSGVDAAEGGEKQRKASVGEKEGEEGSSEEEMLRQVVGSLKKGISKESSNDLQNTTTVNSSPPLLLAQSAVTPHMGEKPVPFVGKNTISEEGGAVSVKEIEIGGGGEIKDKNGATATEFPQTEMSSGEDEVGGREETTKSQTENIGSDLNGVPTAKDPRREDRGLEQPMALTKRSEEESIHSMPNSPWLLATALALALVCILAVLGLGCHLHGPRSCPAPGSKSPFSDLSPTFQSAKLAFSKTPPEERPTSGGSMMDGSSNGLINGTVTGSRAHKFAEWEGRNRPAGSVAVTEHLVDVAGGDVEEEDNDMVYECPGLAPHGEMVVTNPFFMSQELSVERGKVTKAPCPVNVNNNMRHGSINRNLH